MQARTFFFITALCVAISACQPGAPSRIDAPADSAAGVVAFDLVGPGEAALVVPVHLNGAGPYQFVLDTGATLTCVQSSIVDSLDLPERPGRSGFGAGIGGSGSVQIVAIDSLRLGQTTAHDLTACSLNLANLEQTGIQVDGLLGLNFLRSSE